MQKRIRVPTAKPGELKACYGRAERGDSPDICYVWGGEGAHKSDGRILSEALEHAEVFDGKNLRQELEARGYDITTLKFSISQKK